jgi:hypothetical protein
VIAEARWTLQRGARLPRIALHPQDLRHPATAAALGPTLDRWLARGAGHAAAGRAGLGCSEDARACFLFPTGRRVPSPVIRWSARTAFRAWSSLVIAEARWPLQRGARIPRIALHPQDLRHPATAAALGPTLDRWIARHPPVTYGALQG